MKCVILQPSYIPWRGFFHQILKADLFIFYDDVQYDKRSWRNRNRIKTSQGALWLTIPVHTKGVIEQAIPIKDIRISWDNAWNLQHWRAIQYSYRKAPFFLTYQDYFEKVYDQHPELLADFTIQMTVELARMIGIHHTQFMRSSEIPGIQGDKTDRLISILTNVGATHYISGPAAMDYIEAHKFTDAGITLEYMLYDYPSYEQLYPPFNPQVSIIDLMLMTGPHTLSYITGGQNAG